MPTTKEYQAVLERVRKDLKNAQARHRREFTYGSARMLSTEPEPYDVFCLKAFRDYLKGKIDADN